MKVEIIKQNVGIDVSKDHIDVTFSHLNADFRIIVVSTRKFSNSTKGFKQLQDWEKEADMSVHFTMEAITRVWLIFCTNRKVILSMLFYPTKPISMPKVLV